VDGKPIEHRVTHPGQQHPARDELPDQDKTLWPKGLDGQPADPHKDTRYVRFIDPRTGADYTLVTDSYGGRRAVGDLKRQISNIRMAYPDAVPEVKLGSAAFKSQFGTRKRPDFQVVGWRRREGGQSIQRPDKPPPQLMKESSRTRDDMDDEIPF